MSVPSLSRLAAIGVLCACARSQSSPELLADGGNITSIAVSGGDVYWGVAVSGTDFCGGGISRTSSAGKTTTAIAGGCIFNVIATPDAVAWTSGPNLLKGSTLSVAPLDGGAPVIRAAGVNLDGLAADPTGIYVGALVDTTAPDGGFAQEIDVLRFTGDAGPPAVLASTPAETTLGGTETIHHVPPRLALAQGDVYWLDSAIIGSSTTSTTAAAIFRVPEAGGDPVAVVSAQSPIEFTVDETSLYWLNVSSADGTNGALLSMPLAGGAAQTLAQGLADPSGLTKVGSDLYWVNRAEGTLVRMPSGGGAVDVVTASIYPGTGLTGCSLHACLLPAVIAFDDTFVYYGSSAGLWRVRR